MTHAFVEPSLFFKVLTRKARSELSIALMRIESVQLDSEF